MILSSGDCRTKGRDRARFALKMLVAFGVLALFGGGITGLGSTACAGGSLPASCDPAFWESLKNRAMLEAQRETQQNQNLIVKAESVIELTCFDRHPQSLAANAINLFSETTRWGTILPATSMDNALNMIVSNGLINYIANNSFAHTYGSLRYGGNYTPQPASAAAATYDCSEMATVWQAAKCYHFAEALPKDGFMTLRDFIEPRTGVGHELFNCAADGRIPNFRSIGFNDGGQYATANYQSYANLFSATACSDPIPTGVNVERVGIDAYEEHICINPGCAFDRQGQCVNDPP